MTCELQAPMKHWQIWVNHFFSWTEIVLLIPLGLVRISRNKRSVNWANWPVHPYFFKTWSTVQMGLQVFSIQSWSDCCGVLLNILSQEGSSYNKRFQTDLIPVKLWTLTSPRKCSLLKSWYVVSKLHQRNLHLNLQTFSNLFGPNINHQTGWKIQRRPLGVLLPRGDLPEIAQVLMHRRMYNVSSTPPITSTSKHTLWSVSEAELNSFWAVLVGWVELEFFRTLKNTGCPWKWMAGILVY